MVPFERRRSHWGTTCLLLLGISIGFGGCTDIGVRQAIRNASFPNPLQGESLSRYTAQALRLRDLETVYQRDPTLAISKLQELIIHEPKHDLVLALAETHLLLASSVEKVDSTRADGLYYMAAAYAYHYLFDTANLEGEVTPAVNPYDPRSRFACDLYNSALAKCLRRTQDSEQIDLRQPVYWPSVDETLRVSYRGFQWQPDEFGAFAFCADYDVVGLENVYRDRGLGVPLIGTRREADVASSRAVRFPHALSFPVTAVYHFKGTLADVAAHPPGHLELCNPLTVPSVKRTEDSIPLESDLTTPLCYFQSKSDLNQFRLSGLLRASEVQAFSGLYLFEPYQPGKIPVILVHGLMSSPLTWVRLFNDLQADPAVHDHFQFWFYTYPTGNPLLLAAADLRQNLDRIREELDPQHHDAALDDMVVLGHSMGGLVVRLLTVDSGDAFWGMTTTLPFHSLALSDRSRDELQRMFFFEHQRLVQRVIFLGTPFGGSEMAGSWPARLAIPFIRQPHTLRSASRELTRERPQDFPMLPGGELPSSLDLILPGSTLLRTLAVLPTAAGIHCHIIAGVIPFRETILDRVLAGTFGDELTDGVVSYRSAHLEGAESELIVPADHKDIKHHPRTVLEVRRILLEHFQAFKNGQSTVEAWTAR